MRAQIALLEHMGPYAPQGCDTPRGHVIWPTITEQQYIRDLVFAEKVIEEYWPITETTAEVGCPFWPVDAVSCTDVDAFNLHAALTHNSRKLMHERPWRALKK